MKRTTILVAALCAASALAGWVCGRHYTATPQPTLIETTDTIISHDTVVIRQPPEKSRRRIASRRIAVADTTARDTVEVELPVVSVMYADSLCDAWVSGIEPRLDSIRLRLPVTEIHTQAISQQPQRRRRWGVGLGAGLTATSDGRIAPGVYVGITYNIIQF